MNITRQKINPKSIEYLCYRHPKSNIYKLANKEGKHVGTMVAMPEFISDNDIYNPDKKNYYSLYIKRLFINKEERGKGAGTALLNIAAADSYRRNCHGDVHLIAQALENYGTPPQKFYRKNGFDSQKAYHIETIDKAIKENTKLPPLLWITPMFKKGK
jgi:GNAT superfamily N-acetyltransferase